MAVNQSEYHHAEQTDEIDLIDYIDVLCKWKKLILLGTLSCMFITGVVSFFLPPVYQIRTIIEIGSIVKDGSDGYIPIEDPASLVEKINGHLYDAEVRKNLNIKDQDYPELKVSNPKKTDLVEIVIESAKREQAVRILKGLVELIMKDHLARFENERAQLTYRVRQDENQINFLKKEREIIEQKIQWIQNSRVLIKKQRDDAVAVISVIKKELVRLKKSEKSDDIIESVYLSDRLNNNQKYYKELEEKLSIHSEEEEAKLKNALNDNEKNFSSLVLEQEKLNSQVRSFRETRVAEEASNSEMPVRPRKILDTILAGFLGFAFFTCVAFFINYLREARISRLLNNARELRELINS